MAILRKFSSQEKERSIIHRSGSTENFFEDSSGRRTTVSSAPILSWTFASWTTTLIGRPSVSTTMCSLRPLIFLLPSIPRSASIWWEDLTLLESMMPRLGISSRPISLRTIRWSASISSSNTPSNFHLLSSRRRCCGAGSPWATYATGSLSSICT